MSLDVAVRATLGAFALDAAFSASGRLTALFGRSGSGKTTVLNAIAGLVRPDSGRIAVDGATLFDSAAGVRLAPHRRRIGYVFQEGRLFPHLSVRANLLYGRWFARLPLRGPEVDRAVALLGLDGLLSRRVAGLSGGERQRVALGRALLSQPRLLLLDEPFAALDEARKRELAPWIERLRDEGGVPIVLVSHAPAEVARFADHVVLMADGRVLASGPPADVLGLAAATSVAEPGEAAAALDARVAGLDAAFHLSVLHTPAGPFLVPRVDLPIGSATRLLVRAADVMLASAKPEGVSELNAFEGRVADVAEAGPASLLVGLDCNGARLLARITRKSAATLGVAPGKPMWAVVKSVALDGARRG